MSQLWVPPSAEKDLRSRGGTRLSDAETLDRLARFSMGPRNEVPENDPSVREMASNRRIAARARRTAMQKTAVTGFGGGGSLSGGDLSLATGRPKDPMFYWQNSGLPYDITNPEQLKKIREFSRFLYLVNPTVASAIDIYSKFPMTGMELVCKDKKLTEFYTEQFFDEDGLNYEEYLVDAGREKWITGEAWPLGSFNELLGVWEDDELLNADDIEVLRSPFLREPRLFMKLPEVLRKIIQERKPKWEYEALVRSYPELVKYASDNDRMMPVSNVLLRQLRFKAGPPGFERGVPIMLRGFRAVMQQEMLNSAVDAIADRLYTPLVLVKLGASASDLGTNTPWIPNEDDLATFEDSLDAALAADFRVLTHHFAVDMSTVFGRETVPNLDADFERLESQILQVFGMSKTLLNGAEQGETYAADAMNRDLISQLLTGHQKVMRSLYRHRALVIAEAQQHYDYEERGGQRYPVMEEIIETDEETGEQRIVEQPKLLIPELRFKAMNMQDEKQHQQFVEALREAGVPISMKTRLVNVDIDLEEEIEATAQEQIDLAVKAQETRKRTYQALRDRGLPIPEDLVADFEPRAADAPESTATDQQTIPTLGTTQPAETDALVPQSTDQPPPPKAKPEEEEADHGVPDEAVAGGGARVVPLPRNRSRPAESDEQRSRMPKPAVLGAKIVPKVADVDDDGEPVERDWLPLVDGPIHVGHRAKIDPNKPLDEQVG